MVLDETERLKEGVVGQFFLEVEGAQSDGEAVTVTVVTPEWDVDEALLELEGLWGFLEVEWLWGLRLLFVPVITPDDDAVPELALALIVMEWFPLPLETLEAVPEEPVEDLVEVGPVLMLAEEDGKGAEASQLRTSKATVPRIVIK